MGYGIIVYNDESDLSMGTCLESSNNAAYKNMQHGIYFYQETMKFIVSHSTFIDNRWGYGAALSVKGWSKTSDYGETIVEFNDNHVYGQSEAEDCPADGSFCKPFEKMGFFMSGAYFGGKPAHVEDI